MSHSRGKLHTARFCPWCAGEIERDYYNGNETRRVEFICPGCGVGFGLIESSRRQAANRMFAAERRLRVPNPGKEHSQMFKVVCKRKYRELRRVAIIDSRRLIGDQMKEWLASDEGVAARNHYDTEATEILKQESPLPCAAESQQAQNA